MTPYLNWDISPALQPHKTSIPAHFVSRALNFLHIKSFQIEFYQFCLSELLKSSSYFKNVSLYYLIVLGNCHLFIYWVIKAQISNFLSFESVLCVKLWSTDMPVVCWYCKDFLLFLLDIEVHYYMWVVWELWYLLELAILTDVVMSGKTMLYYVLCYLLSANALGTWQHFSDDFFCVLE